MTDADLAQINIRRLRVLNDSFELQSLNPKGSENKRFFTSFDLMVNFYANCVDNEAPAAIM